MSDYSIEPNFRCGNAGPVEPKPVPRQLRDTFYTNFRSFQPVLSEKCTSCGIIINFEGICQCNSSL